MALSRDISPSFRLKLWLPPLVIAAVIYALSALPDLTVAATAWVDLLLRKAGHIAVYALLSLSLYRAIAATQPAHATRWTIGSSILYALTDEYHQLFVHGRSGSLTDVTIDAFGVLLGVVVWHVFLLSKSKKRR